MKRTLETIFRHGWQLCVLVVLFPLIGVGVAYVFLPKTYQATASLWALRRYQVIGATGPESDLSATPSQTQATALTDLLQTRSFTQEVTQHIDLASTLDLGSSVLSDPQQLQDALFKEISTKVAVTSAGYNLFKLSYTSKSAQVAQQIVQAVITDYGTQSRQLSVAEGTDLLASYQAQLKTAIQEENIAVSAQAQYLAQHPGESSSPGAEAADPEYQQLQASTTLAQEKVQNLQGSINTVEQAINSTSGAVNSLFATVDEPQILPVPRSRNYLVGAGVGLGVALLAYIIFLVIVVRRDRTIYSATDLQDFSTVPVIMQLPRLTTPSVLSLVHGLVNE